MSLRHHAMRSISCLVAMMICLVICDPGSAAERHKEVAGKADFLRHVPKKFATLVRVDARRWQVEIRAEGEAKARVWDVLPDAEFKVRGWWGRLDQFTPGDRVWVWFAIDRKKQPKAVLLLADEISEQLLHGLPHTLKRFDAQAGTVTVRSEVSGERTLSAPRDWQPPASPDAPLHVQSAGKAARVLADEAQLEALRREQMDFLREDWRRRGLPGTVTMLHPLGGEMELTLDHEAMRWARWLKNGDAVTLATAQPVRATVKFVEPWRERTRLRLVTQTGADQADLTLGERIALRVPEPPADVQHSDLPTDIGRAQSKEERIEWLLASSYCSCGIQGDQCTGMVYTLASCNVNACGMPNQIRGMVRKLIDEGLSDEQVWRELEQKRGPLFSRQHLLK
jgi:hypothetical protein